MVSGWKEHWRTFTPADKLKVILTVLGLSFSLVIVTHVVSTSNFFIVEKSNYIDIRKKYKTSYGYEVRTNCFVSSQQDLDIEVAEQLCKQ